LEKDENNEIKNEIKRKASILMGESMDKRSIIYINICMIHGRFES
jgi:hypothetical protein